LLARASLTRSVFLHPYLPETTYIRSNLISSRRVTAATGGRWRPGRRRPEGEKRSRRPCCSSTLSLYLTPLSVLSHLSLCPLEAARVLTAAGARGLRLFAELVGGGMGLELSSSRLTAGAAPSSDLYPQPAKNWLTTSHLFNQTKKWLSLTTPHLAQPNKKLATPNQLVGDTSIPKIYH
jgi:hypothetical protein